MRQSHFVNLSVRRRASESSPHHLSFRVPLGGRETTAIWGVPEGTQTPVTAVTVPASIFGDTSNVNMVRRVCKKILFEPGDTRQQWKGEAAASLV